MKPASVATTGLIAGILGVVLTLAGLGGLASDVPPVAALVMIVLGVVFFLDGRRQWHVNYPRAVFRQRVQELGDPAGMSLRDVRRKLGHENDYERTGDGSRLTWRNGKLSLTLEFDRAGQCTGTVAAAGFGAMH